VEKLFGDGDWQTEAAKNQEKLKDIIAVCRGMKLRMGQKV
jgi:hypothetical protein